MSANVPPADEMEHNPHLEISVCHSASNFQINNSTFNAYDPAGERKRESELKGRRIAAAMEMLAARAEKGAPYDAAAREDVPKCQEHTRVAIIDGIHQWAHSIDPDTKPLMWMYGPAGSGKTTIMQTVAEMLDRDDDGSLVASFFFSKLSQGRPREKTNFVITMAHQLSVRRPAVQPRLADILATDVSILDKALHKQLDFLLLRPLAELYDEDNDQRERPVVFLVDGLDECEEESAQRLILNLVHSLSMNLARPGSIRILLACRPLSHIQTFFSNRTVADVTRTVPLDNDYKANEDIRAFLLSEFGKIRSEHPAGSALPSDWPTMCDIHTLVERASGQFIYAAVVMRYIACEDKHPRESLRKVLSLVGGDPTPYRQLDALYTEAMRVSVVGPEHLDFVKTILACFLTDVGGAVVEGIQASLLIADQLCGLQGGTTEIRLHRLLPLVFRKVTNISYPSHWELVHLSFRDYLLDSCRSGQFFIDLEEMHANLACLGIRWVSEDRILHRTCAPHLALEEGHDCSTIHLQFAGPSEKYIAYNRIGASRAIFAPFKQAKWTLNLYKSLMSLNIEDVVLWKGVKLDSANNFWTEVASWVVLLCYIKQYDKCPSFKNCVAQVETHIFQGVCAAIRTAHSLHLVPMPPDEWYTQFGIWPQLEVASLTPRGVAWLLRWPDSFAVMRLFFSPLKNPDSRELMNKVLRATSSGNIDKERCAALIALSLARQMVSNPRDPVLYRALPYILLNHAPPNSELATFIQNELLLFPFPKADNFLRRYHPNEDDWVKYFTSLDIYLRRCNIITQSQHDHPPEFDHLTWMCGKCRLPSTTPASDTHLEDIVSASALRISSYSATVVLIGAIIVLMRR